MRKLRRLLGFGPTAPGFTLTEGVIAVVLLGLLVALGIPVFIGLVQASKDQDAISRANTLNQAQQTYKWRVSGAATSWSGAAGNEAKYALLQPYVPFNASYPTLASFTPAGYSFTLGACLDTRVALTGPGGSISY